MDSPFAHSPAVQGNLYTQVAIFTLGNTFSLVLALLVYNLWVVFSDFRDPILWALLSSVALREPKDWIVHRLSKSLDREDCSALWALTSIAAAPFTSLFEVVVEVRRYIKKWNVRARALMQQQQQQRAAAAAAGSSRTPVSPFFTTTAAQQQQQVHSTLSPKRLFSHIPPTTSKLSTYVRAGLDVLQSTRITNKRRKKKSSRTTAVGGVLPQAGGAGAGASWDNTNTGRPTMTGGATMLSWLLRACLAWILYQWVVTAWSATMQVLVLTLSILLVLAGIPLLFFTTNWLGAAVLTPLKTPLSPVSRLHMTGGGGGGGITTTRGAGAGAGGVKKKGGGSQASPITDISTTTTTTKPTTTTAHKRKVAESSPNSSPFLHNTKRQETIPEDTSPYSSSLSFQLDNSTPTQFRHGFRNDSYNGTHTTDTDTNMSVMSTVLKGATWAANGTVVSMRALLRSMDRGLKNGLKANLDALASLLLILALMIGTTALALFLSARVAQEGRTAVTTFKNSFPAAWANAAAATFTPRHIDLSPAVIVDHIEGEGQKGDEQQGIGEKDNNEQQQATPLEQQEEEQEIDVANRLLLQHQQEEQQLPEWLAKYQKDAIDLAQSSLPGLIRWMDARLIDFVTANNLTAALTDVRLIVETVQGPRRCSERGRENRVVEAARAEVRAAEAEGRLKAAEVGLEEARRALSDAVVRLNEMQSPSEEHKSGSKGSGNIHDDKKKNACGINNNNGGGTSCIHSTTNNKDNNKSSSWLVLQNEIVRADAAVNEARHIHDLASSASEEAQRTLHSTTARLALCVDNEINSTRSGRHLTAYDHDHHHVYEEGKEGEMDMKQGTTAGPPSSQLPGLAGELSERLQSGYAKLWRRQLREGVADIKAAAMHAMDALRNATQLPATSGGNASSSSSSGSASAAAAAADLTALQRLVAAIAEPLLAIGRLIAVYVGSSAAAALMGGLGVLRLGIGVFKIGTQLVLFLALLYYLLAARRDPLLHAAAVLPLSDRGRRRVAAALNRALGGVLSSMLRLVIFHGAFTWLLHSILNAPLVYTTTVASGISALLPFVPTPVVATPSTALLAFYYKKPLKAMVLALAQLAAYWNGDTIILQDVGHAYLMSLGILGGLYAFDNPLQGCILGPVLLSLSSVLYELHSEFMGASSSSHYGVGHNNNNMNNNNTAGMMFRGGGGPPTKAMTDTNIISNTVLPSGMPSLRVDIPSSPAGSGAIRGAVGKEEEGEEEEEEASLAVHVVGVEGIDSDEVVSRHRPGSSGMGSGSSFSFLQHQDGKTKSE